MAETLSLATRSASAESGNRGSHASAAAQGDTITLVVENMRCGGCIRAVEGALLGLPGVSQARVNLSTRRVMISARSGAADAETCVEALRHAGFAAFPLATAGPTHKNAGDVSYLPRVAVAGFAAANIMLLSVSVWSGGDADMPASLKTLFHWLSALIALPAVAYAGQPFFASARHALAARRLNMDVPISLGVILATGMSLYQTVRGSEQVYFDAAVTLLFFLLIGRGLDQAMRAKAVSAAHNLLGMRSSSATVVQSDGATQRAPTSSIVPGMRVLVASGERIPVDARIASGAGSIDESIMTGESRPRRVGVGDQIYAGTINLADPFEAIATASEENTLLAEMAHLMQSAEQARGRYVRLADRAAQLYAPAVHVLGLATFIGWLIAGYGWEAALTAAIAVLIITCPCALALAVPATQVAATSRLFKRGVIIKAADGLERLAEVDTVVFDKTGTVTLGRPRLVNADGVCDRVLAHAASLAAASRHPYSQAIVRAARERGLEVSIVAGVEEIPGAGLRASSVDGASVLGSATLCGVEPGPENDAAIWFKSPLSPAVKLVLEDAIRADAADVVAALARGGYAIEVLSGDASEVVDEVAGRIGVTSWRARQRPDAKISRLRELSDAGRKVLMVGDGLNDAPALAAGHASLSPSSAADVSQMAADAVFQGELLAPIIEVLAVAKAARRRALQNFAIAIGYNVLFVPLAMAGLVTPLIAAVAMSASSIAVTANALRLGFQRLELTS